MGRIWNGTDKDRHDSKTPPTKDPSSYFGVQKNNGRPTKLHTTKKTGPINQFARRAVRRYTNQSVHTHAPTGTYALKVTREASWVGRRSWRLASEYVEVEKLPATHARVSRPLCLGRWSWDSRRTRAVTLVALLGWSGKVDERWIFLRLRIFAPFAGICPVRSYFQFSSSCQVVHQKHLVGARMLRYIDLVVTGEYSSRFPT
jgi:hypothetical protein